MNQAETLAGRMLLAMPGMGDPRFARATIALFVHDAGGAFGIDLGTQRPDLSFHALLAELEIDPGMAPGGGPKQHLFALGYAGWGPGQLDNEMHHHGWYAAEGRAGIMFETPAEQRWQAAWRAEGIDPALLASQTGRA